MAFPQTRLRRLRSSASLRGLVRETELRAGQLVLPLFVSETTSSRESIAKLPNVERLSISAALEEARKAAELGIAGVMLFGIPAAKDAEGSGAWDEEGVVQAAVRALKSASPGLL
ncbi:MAG TPA: porphobilinogen synthase, partial [Solirubrobacteraceae bacterium]